MLPQATLKNGYKRRSTEANRFIAFKLRPNTDKDGFVYGLALADLEDRTRFPLGTQADEIGAFVWGSGINEIEEA